VRKVCPKCKVEYRPDPDKLPPDFKPNGDEILHRGEGCPHCRNTGYRSRTGLYELMVMTDAIAEKVMQRAPSPEIVAVARTSGLRLLREDGWLKVRQGITTPDEVLTCTAV
jgi:type IV pilus assembly protein PilB